MPSNADLNSAALVMRMNTDYRKNDESNISTPSDVSTIERLPKWTDGTGNGKADTRHVVELSIAAGATTTLDLVGGVTDTYGNTLTFTKVKGLIVDNQSANANIRVGGGSDGAGTNAALLWFVAGADMVDVPAGGGFAIGQQNDGPTDPSAGSDLLGFKNTHGSETATVQVGIIGEAS